MSNNNGNFELKELPPIQPNLASETIQIIEAVQSRISDFLEIRPQEKRLFLFKDLLENILEIKSRVMLDLAIDIPNNLLADIKSTFSRLNDFLDSFSVLSDDEAFESIKQWNININGLNTNLKHRARKPSSFRESEYSEVISKFSTLQDKYLERLEDIKQTQLAIRTEAETTIAGFQKSADQIFGNLDGEFEKYQKEYELKAKESTDTIQIIVEQARELQRELSGRTLSDFFGKRAKIEETKAKFWTLGTWIFAISTLIVLAIVFYLQINNYVQNKEIDLALLGTKVLFTATLGLIAKWTSKRANRHLSEESKYHRLAINMLSMESFTARLEDSDKNEIIKAVALKTFTETNENDVTTDFETASAIDFIKGLLPKADGK